MYVFCLGLIPSLELTLFQTSLQVPTECSFPIPPNPSVSRPSLIPVSESAHTSSSLFPRVLRQTSHIAALTIARLSLGSTFWPNPLHLGAYRKKYHQLVLLHLLLRTLLKLQHAKPATQIAHPLRHSLSSRLRRPNLLRLSSHGSPQCSPSSCFSWATSSMQTCQCTLATRTMRTSASTGETTRAQALGKFTNGCVRIP